MKPLALPEFEDMAEHGCQMPGCAHQHPRVIYLNQRCHPKAGLEVLYEKGTGILQVRCKECAEPVADAALALI